MTNALLLKGEFTENDITILTEAKSNREILPSIEQQIDSIWRKALTLNPKMWDSEGYRLNSFEFDKSDLVLKIAAVNHKTHFGLKALHRTINLSEEKADRILVADALIKTKDRKYILGMANKLHEENEIYLIGGTCTKSRLELKSSKDLFSFLAKRVAEVLNINDEVLKNIYLCGIIQNEIGCVNLIFNVEIELRSDEIVSGFKPNNGISGLVIVDENEIKNFLQNSRNYTECLATLL